MHPLAAEPDRVTDGGSAQSTRRDPVFAGATQSSQRRRGQTRPVQRQFGSGITFLGKRTGGAFGNETAHQAQDRKSVVWGKSVDLGGRRIIKKKKKKKQKNKR